MPITVFGANLIIVIISLTWLFSGDYKSKFSKIINSKLLLASILFFSLHVFGLIWTEDLDWGLHIVHKMWYFIGLFPILYTIVRVDYVKYYISSFLVAISFTEMISYLIWFEIIEPFKYATVENPTAFMSHISYNPILAIAIYIVFHEVLFSPKITYIKRFFYSLFTITMSINMFITGGRAGQVMFFAVIAIIIFQYFHSKKLKAIILIIICTTSIFFTAFQASVIFQNRVLHAIEDVKNFSGNPDKLVGAQISRADNNIHKKTAVGLRINFTLNSWQIIKNNPIIGVGTGDFPIEYQRVNAIYSPEIQNTTNPHNMYILILTELGIIGLASFLLIFYYQIKLSFISVNRFNRDFGLTLPLLFLLVMLSDSYLLGHYTTLVYIFFSSFLYKDFEKS